MASSRAGTLPEASTGGFSYAMAAKGRSPSAPSAKSATISGTTTPASNSNLDSTPGSSWADDGEINGAINVSENKGDEGCREEEGVSEKNGVLESSDITRSQDSPAADNSGNVQQNGVVEESHKETTSPPGTVDSNTVQGSSESAKDPESIQSEGETKTAEDSAEAPKAKAAPKPVYREAKPPTVNPWMQRSADAKAKAAASAPSNSSSISPSASNGVQSENERSRVDPRRKPDQNIARDPRKTESKVRDDVRNGRPRRESRSDENALPAQRKAPIRPREHANSDAVVNSDVSWPKPMGAHDDDRKKSQDGQDRAEKDRVAANSNKGRPDWKVMPYTPTAIFETQITGKGSGRMGKGAARGVPTNSGRGPTVPVNGTNEGAKPSIRAASLPNGEASPVEKTEIASTMPAPPAKAGRATSGDDAKDSKQPEQTKNVSPVNADAGKAADTRPVSGNDPGARQVPAARRNKSPRKSDAFVGQSVNTNGTYAVPQSDGAPAESFVNGSDTAQSRPPFADRRAENHSVDAGQNATPFREGKRRGGKGGRGGFNNPHYNSSHMYNNSFTEHQNGAYGMPPPFSPRGGHFSQGNRNGYRHQSSRSQSIPLDAFGRAMPYGYPMMPPQNFAPEYYGGYAAGPYGFVPQSERDVLIGTVLFQIDYYFSMDNLLKDIFLRKRMDSQGWIFLDVVAEFNRLKSLTTDYEVLKQACLQSHEIEIRVGEDGRDRLRRNDDWERWVLPKEERDASAQADPPQNLHRPSAARGQSLDQVPTFYPASPAPATPQSGYPRMDRSFQMMNGGPPPFYPAGSEPRFQEFVPQEEVRGRQPKSITNHEPTTSPMANGHSESSGPNDEQDTFPSSQIEGLTVVVRKHDLRRGAPFHNANSRTFSNGSIDSRNIMEEVSKVQVQESTPQVNGVAPSDGTSDANASAVSSPSRVLSPQQANALTLFWVKDKENPVEVNTLPPDTTHEPYVTLRYKALSQREEAATGTCPYDLDVLYQFWSHFLIRNFNAHMYGEFRHFATEDSSKRHNDIGTKNLIKFYSEAMASQIPVRESVAREYAELIKTESTKSERPAFTQLRTAWHNGAFNLRNRKILGNVLDEAIKTALDA